MKYRADYLTPTDDRGATQLIFADSDEAAHTLALLHIPDGMTLHSVYRVKVRPDERRRIRDTLSDTSDPSKGQLYDTLELLLNALDEADSEAETLRARVAELEGRVGELEGERETLRHATNIMLLDARDSLETTLENIKAALPSVKPAVGLVERLDRARGPLGEGNDEH